MANAYERWSDRTGSKAANNADVGVRVFDITDATSEADCYAATLVLSDLGGANVPVLNEVDPRNSKRKVNSLAVSQPGWNLYRLAVGYAIPPNGSFSDTEDNPLTQPTRWSFQRSKTVEQVDRDKDGNAIITSNLVPFANGAQRTYTQRILEARRFESAYDAATAEVFEDSVNNATFNGPGVSFGSGTVKCNIISPVGEYTTSSPYLEILYQFEIRPDGWKTRQLDEGVMGRDAGGQFLPLYAKNGDKVTSPVLLNGGGNPIEVASYLLGNPTTTIPGASAPASPTGSTVEASPDGKATFLRYSLYPERNLNALGL